MCHSLLDQSAVNHAIDEWKRRLSACVNAKGGHFYDCYSQTNNVEMAVINLITGDDFLFSFAGNVNEQRTMAFLTEKCCFCKFTK